MIDAGVHEKLTKLILSRAVTGAVVNALVDDPEGKAALVVERGRSGHVQRGDAARVDVGGDASGDTRQPG